MIPDFLEGASQGHKMGCTSMTKAMGAWVFDGNSEFPYSPADDGPQASCSERLMWSSEPNKKSPVSASRSHRPQVTNDGVAHGRRKGIGSETSLLRPTYQQLLPFPVDVIQLELADFVNPESIDGKKQQDGPVTNIFGPVRVGAGD